MHSEAQKPRSAEPQVVGRVHRPTPTFATNLSATILDVGSPSASAVFPFKGPG